MFEIVYNLQKSIEIVNHIKSDSRFIIDCNGFSNVQSNMTSS